MFIKISILFNLKAPSKEFPNAKIFTNSKEPKIYPIGH